MLRLLGAIGPFAANYNIVISDEETPSPQPRTQIRGPQPASPTVVNFIPFGAGQFQNGEPAKGAAFAVAEGVTGATSLGIFVYLGLRYGLQNNAVPIADGGQVRTLQRVEIASGVAFFGLYAWGVIDAIVHARPRAPSTSVTLGPMLVPDGGGVMLGWSR